LTSVMVDLSAVTAEGKKTSGEDVYLQLRPRDPRDPLLGDYMAVNFQVCDEIAAVVPKNFDLSTSGKAWVRRDERRVLRFDSIDEGVEKPGLLRIRYSVSKRQVSIGTTKVYFQEGDERRFRNARYGRFKLQDDGRLTWLGFTDENLKDL